jgi:hypothetical protein
MKTKITSLSLSQAARLLSIICATLASGFCLLGTAAAQTNIPYDTLTYHIPADADTTIQDTKTITDTLTVNSISFNTNSTLIIDGTLRVKSISCDAPDATMILCPNAVVDLGGSILIVSSLTLTDGTEAMHGYYDCNNEDSVISLSNGAKLIHGIVILGMTFLDSPQPNAIHLVESNEHSSATPGTLTLRNQN